MVVDAALVAPATILPNAKLSGLMVSWPAMPTPLRAAEPALLLAASLIASDAVRVPSAPGVKVSATEQLAPGASVEPQVLLVIVNSPALAPLV